MKQKTVGMLLLVALALSGMSVASAQTLTYTGDQYVPCCNVCLEATFLDGQEPIVGAVILFTIDSLTVGIEPTDENGVATLCIGEYASDVYNVFAVALVDGNPQVFLPDFLTVYESKAAGGGQIIDDESLKKKDQQRISFGMGFYKVAGEWILESCEVTFHNVSEETLVSEDLDSIDKYKFVGEEDGMDVWSFDCYDKVAKIDIYGYLFDKTETEVEDADYSMRINLQDLGEPNYEDNIRFVLYRNGTPIYDTHDSEFGELWRNATANGNLQVECCDCPVPD